MISVIFQNERFIVPYSQHNDITRIARNFIIKMNLFARQITSRASSSEESYYRPHESTIRTYALTKANGSYSQASPRIDQMPISQMWI
jgi:phage FluMu gp28-like protein